MTRPVATFVALGAALFSAIGPGLGSPHGWSMPLDHLGRPATRETAGQLWWRRGDSNP